MLIHLHVKNLALIEDIEVEFGPGLNILTGETGAGKSVLLGSMQLILGGRTARDMIRTGASCALVELLFQVENKKAEQALNSLGIFTEEGQVLLSRKIMDGRSINKINGETCTVGQMKAAAECLLDIHGQHEHQSLLYQEKQLEILDAYGREKIRPAKEAVRQSYEEYRKYMRALKELDTDEEQRNREKAFLEFEISEIEKAHLVPGEDEELETLYRRLNNGKLILETLQSVHSLTGYDSGQGAGEAVGTGVRELLRVTEYDTQLESMEGLLCSVKSVPYDFTVAYRICISFCGDYKNVGAFIKLQSLFQIFCIFVMKGSVAETERHRAGFSGNNMRISLKRVCVDSGSFCAHPVRTGCKYGYMIS